MGGAEHEMTRQAGRVDRGQHVPGRGDRQAADVDERTDETEPVQVCLAVLGLVAACVLEVDSSTIG